MPASNRPRWCSGLFKIRTAGTRGANVRTWPSESAASPRPRGDEGTSPRIPTIEGGCFGTTRGRIRGDSGGRRRAGVRADRSKSARLADGGRRRVRVARKSGVKNGRGDVDTHHLRGGTALSGSPVLLQWNGLVSPLPLLMRARTSHGRYHHSWAHPAILPYIKTCTTSHVARRAGACRRRLPPFCPPPVR